MRFVALAADFDGTLAPTVPRPGQATDRRTTSSGRVKRTLAQRINIDAKVAPLGERKADRA